MYCYYVYRERTPLFTRLNPFIYCIGNPQNIPPRIGEHAWQVRITCFPPPLLSYTRSSLDVLPCCLPHLLRESSRRANPHAAYHVNEHNPKVYLLCWGFSWRVHSVYVFSVSSVWAGKLCCNYQLRVKDLWTFCELLYVSFWRLINRVRTVIHVVDQPEWLGRV